MAASLSPSDRRARSRAYKDAFPPMGVFAVRNLASGRVYVNASTNVDGALNRIRFELERGAYRRSPALMRDWLALGAGSFRFEVLERVRQRDDPAFDHEAELATLLALWQDELRCFGPDGYNGERT